MIGYNAYQNSFTGGYATPTATSINWVQGETGAKAAYVSAGDAAILMDSEAITPEGGVFYIKSVSKSGIPDPLTICDYTIRNAQPADGYVKKEEIEEMINKIVEEKMKGLNGDKDE